MAKVGHIETRWTRDLPSQPSSVTIVMDASGRYHARFTVEMAEQEPQSVSTEVGIDVGLTDLAVLSTGEKISNPRHVRKAARKLARAQRAFSRTRKGSANRDKARAKIARLHARVKDRRSDYLHKITTCITSENQAVYIEDLAVSGLARTKMAKSVYDASWAALRFQFAYKQQMQGHYLGLHPRFQRSTGVCPQTGELVSLSLADRSWSCSCGTVHDRDVAAAQIILPAGRAERLNACGGTIRLSPAEQVPAKQEVAA